MDSAIAFTSFDRIGIIRSDGSDEHYPDLRNLMPASNQFRGLDTADPDMQRRWQWGPLLPDGSGITVTSYEETAIEKVVVGELRTRCWILNFQSGMLRPILEWGRPSKYTICTGFTPAGMIASVILQGEQRLFLYEGNPASPEGHFEPITHKGEGFHYGVDIAPDGTSLVCHVTGQKETAESSVPWHVPYPSYSIHRIDIPGGKRTVLYGDEAHLYFGPRYSPSGDLIAFLDCTKHEDPAHFWADICVAPVGAGEDSSGNFTYRSAPTITEGQIQWFGTSYGTAEHRGGGSNMPIWSHDGCGVIYTRKIPGSHPDCIYDPSRPDHQELVYCPEMAAGGTQLCCIDPETRETTELTEAKDGTWDFRPAVSEADGSIAFARAQVSRTSELWVCDANGEHARRLAAGYMGMGADHPRWVPDALIQAVTRALE